MIVWLLKPLMRLLGFPRGGRRVIKMFWRDFARHRSIPLRTKAWAYRHGFLSSHVLDYGITAENLSSYLPDAYYYRVSANVNHPFSTWLNDKLTTQYVLSPFSSILEELVAVVVNGKVFPKPGSPGRPVDSPRALLQWVRENGPLGLKKTRGSQGFGFVKLACGDDSFLWNGAAIDEEMTVQRIEGLNHYLAVRFLTPHDQLARIYPASANAIRVMTTFDVETRHVALCGAYIRFGTNRSEPVEHLIHGGVAAGIHLETGEMFAPVRSEKGRFLPITSHPDTGEAIAGLVPFWKEVVDLATKIAHFLPFTPHLSFDIVVTNEGPRILEINSHGLINLMQRFHPLLSTPSTARLFSEALISPWARKTRRDRRRRNIKVTAT